MTTTKAAIQKPQLTEAALKGLLTLTTDAGARGCAGLLYNDYDKLEAYEQEIWRNVEAAMEWTNAMAAFRQAAAMSKEVAR